MGVLPALASAASLTQITTNFGPNPRNVAFYLYVPDNLPANAPILVNPHWCHGTAQAAFSGSQWATLASQHGFIVIYPGTPATSTDQCWDVSSRETLTHDGGGDSLGIVSMVRWTLDKYKADKSRVFATGVSSGGMMTEVLVGAYPDVFAAGAAFADVPFGCFAAPGNNAGNYDYWNGDCATGKVTHSAQEWGDIVRAAYPGYSGWRPKLQIFHGTADETVSYVNFGEAVKMWTNVFGVSQTPAQVVQNTPLSGWTKSVYGPSGWFEAYSAAGVTHNIPVQENTALAFFQLDCTKGCFSWGQGGPSGGQVSPSSASSSSRTVMTMPSAPVSTTTTRVTSGPAATTTAGAAGASLWAQCGGIGYAGPSACASGACTTYNSYYAQCVPTPA